MGNPKDFSARQIRTSQLIASGGIPGTKAGLIVYSASISSPGFTPDLQGGIPDHLLADVGNDVYFFVSGSKDSKISSGDSGNGYQGVTLFGGDVVFSGTLYAERMVVEVDMSSTGSLMVSGSLFVSRSAVINQGLTVNDEFKPNSHNDFTVKGSASGYEALLMADVSQNRVGIGTSTPDHLLEVSADGLSEATISITQHQPNTQDGATLDFRKALGTTASPAAVEENSQLGNIQAHGYDGTDFLTRATYIASVVDGPVSSNIVPGRIEFWTTSLAGTESRKVLIKNSGHVGVLNNDPVSFLHVGPINSADSTISIDSPANYSASIAFLHAGTTKTTIEHKDSHFAIKNAIGLDYLRAVDHSQLNQVLILSGGGFESPDPQSFTDTSFFVSGSIGGKGGNTRGVSAFGGDAIVSGTFTVGKGHNYKDPNLTLSGSGPNFFITNGGQDGDVYFRINDGGVTKNLLTLHAQRGRVGIGTIEGQTWASDQATLFVSNSIDTSPKIVVAGQSPGFYADASDNGYGAYHVTMNSMLTDGTERSRIYYSSGTNASPLNQDTGAKSAILYTDIFHAGTHYGISLKQPKNTTAGSNAWSHDKWPLFVSSSNSFLPSQNTYANTQVLILSSSGPKTPVGAHESNSGKSSPNPMNFTDTNFWVSGSIGKRLGSGKHIGCFGGDLHISGNLTVGGSSPGGGGGGSSHVTGTFNVVNENNFVTTASVSIAGQQGFNYTAASQGSDTLFFVTGSAGSRGTPNSNGTSVFGGDLVVSGGMHAGAITLDFFDRDIIKRDIGRISFAGGTPITAIRDVDTTQAYSKKILFIKYTITGKPATADRLVSEILIVPDYTVSSNTPAVTETRIQTGFNNVAGNSDYLNESNVQFSVGKIGASGAVKLQIVGSSGFHTAAGAATMDLTWEKTVMFDE